MYQDVKKTLEILNQQIKELTAIYHQAAGKYGISDNEFWIWYALLLVDGEQSQQSICEMWSLPKQTVNSVVSGMIKRGHIFLEIIPGTRNKKVIRLTEAGKEYGDNIISRVYGAEQRAVEGLSLQERQACARLLEKYTTLLREAFDND